MGEIEQRKLIKFGKNSYVISLPKSWVEANKLKKGAVLRVKSTSEELRITPKTVIDEERVKKIACEGQVKIGHLETRIVSAYKANYHTIIIEGQAVAKYSKEIKNILKKLTGIEVIEQDSRRIVAKDLIDIKQITVSTMINRMDMMVRSMFQDLLENKEIDQKMLKERDKDLNRLNYFMTRILRKAIDNPGIAQELKTSTIDAYYVEKLNNSLEKMGDYVKRLQGDLERAERKQKTKNDYELKELKGLIKTGYKKYLESMKAYYKGDEATAVKIQNEVIKMLKNINKNILISENNHILAFENVKNIFRELRTINRVTIEKNYD